MTRTSPVRSALLYAPLLALTLGGCDTVDGWFGNAPEPPLPGQRVSVLSGRGELQADPRIADVAVTVPPAETNAEWAQAGGNPEHSLQHPQLGASPREAWRSDVGTGSSSARMLISLPVVAEGRVYAMDAESHVAALDAAGGRSLWRIDTRPDGERGRATGGGVAFAGGRIFASTGYGEVLALSPADGRVIWRKRVAGPVRGAPTVMDGRVYVVTLDNQLVALSVDDGTEIWTHQGILEAAGILGTSSPAVTGTLVVAAYSSGELYGLRPENGRVAWQENLASVRRGGALSNLADIRGLPVIDRGRVFAISHGDRMIAVDERIGARIWEADIGGTQTPWSAGDFLFVLTNNAEVVALTREAGRVRWIAALDRFEDPEDRDGPIVWSGPVLAGGRLWVTGSHGQMLALSPANGSVAGRYPLPSGTYLPPIVANNTLYVLSDSGTLVAFR
ncbi:PQQ-binding-like beta-propeller repeat protein [Azospirillum sp. SYSU D00513]|uniref:outer membrane protein assembly factor BamB family protein n=1 Tax=Azospirillum sp. SYSU D00513 TaxID=2812561 RepID=UPI001A978061|nr:PQQ-binding-like beta-propeller repeat protein [Azospirillum sp. SYSU D00513]